MAEWLVELQGDPYDLDALMRVLPSGEESVFRDEHGYWLRSVQFASQVDAAAVRTIACGIVELLNGAQYISIPNSLPVAIGSPVWIGDDGSRHTYEWGLVRAKVRVGALDTFTSPNEGQAPPQELAPPTETIQLAMRLGESNLDVAKALRLLGKSQDWGTLYKVFEVIRSDVGGLMFTEQWVSKAETRLFKHTANSAATLEDDARHGQTRTEPPPKPMSYEEARSFIQRLFSAWIQYKRGATP